MDQNITINKNQTKRKEDNMSMKAMEEIEEEMEEVEEVGVIVEVNENTITTDAAEAEDKEAEDVLINASEWNRLTTSEVATGIRGYLNEIGRYKVLSIEEEKMYAQRMHEGDQGARDMLIKHNLRLVVAVAKRYTNCGIQIDELIGYGNMGLIEAVKRFDSEKGFKLSTYATYWIKMHIEKGIRECKNHIAKPDHAVAAMIFVQRVYNKLELTLARVPTMEEVSMAINGKFTPQQVETIMGWIMNTGTISLDKKLDATDGDSAVLGDMIADSTVESPMAYTERNERDEVIAKAISELKPTYRLVLKMRYGLGLNKETATGGCGEDREYTLDEVAEELFRRGYKNKSGERFTKEYIRQLEKGALNTLKQNQKLAALAAEGGY